MRDSGTSQINRQIVRHLSKECFLLALPASSTHDFSSGRLEAKQRTC